MKAGAKTTHTRSLRGFTLVELMVSLTISSMIFLALVSQYSLSANLSHDHRVRIETILQAQAVMQTIGAEIRMLGNGVPFDQANFEIGENTLSDPTVTEPIQLSSLSTTSITFRINETGQVYLLTQDFDPSSTSTINLTSVDGLDVNDPIYLSNSVVSGSDGFYGTITAVDPGTSSITVDPSTYVYSPAATFDMGSICEEVPLVTYASSASGITRDSGFGPVLLGANSTLSLEYLDIAGNSLTLPLTVVDLVTTLRSIRVNVSLTSTSNLTSGQPYVANVTQTFGIRNLNYLY